MDKISNLFVGLLLIFAATMKCAAVEYDVSPDGTAVAYVGHSWDFKDPGLFIVDLKTRYRQRLDSWERNYVRIWCPTFAPDSHRLAFIYLALKKGNSGPTEGVPQLWIMGLDGNTKEKIIDLDTQVSPELWVRQGGDSFMTAFWLRWSPDGTHIVYQTPEDVEKNRIKLSIWLIDLKTKTQKRITSKKDGLCTYPVFSPDNKEILFTKGFFLEPEPSIGELWVMRPNGHHKQQLVSAKQGVSVVGPGAWSPDGRHIAFGSIASSSGSPKEHSMRPLEVAACIINRDGTGLKRGISGRWVCPQWSPDGTKILWCEFGQWLTTGAALTDNFGNLLHFFKDVRNAQWFPDNETLAVSDDNYHIGTMKVNSSPSWWDVIDSTNSIEEP